MDFFDEKLKRDRAGHDRLLADIKQVDGGVLKHEAALTPPPSAAAFSALIVERGFDTATALVDRYRREIPDEPVIEQNVFNDFAYRLIAESRFTEAISMMRLLVYVYPKSANAVDGLADAYIAAGRKELARATLQQVLKLIPDDASLNESNKQYMTKVERAKLDQLKP
jgi:tetratricopeptide (TPR) repeat protein